MYIIYSHHHIGINISYNDEFHLPSIIPNSLIIDLSSVTIIRTRNNSLWSRNYRNNNYIG